MHLTLRPLNLVDVRAALSTPGAVGGARLAESLRHRTDGIPFLSAGVLKLPREQWVGPAAVVPPAIVRVFRARLSRMPSGASALLRQAADRGAHMDMPALAGELDVPVETLHCMAATAAEAGVLIRECDPHIGDGRGVSYRFTVLARDMLLSDAVPARSPAPADPS